MQEAGTYIKKTYHRLRNSGTWSSIFDAVLFVGSIVFAVNVLMNLLGFFIASGFMEQKITLLVWEMSREQSSLFWFFILYTCASTFVITYLIVKLYDKIINRPVKDFKTELSEMAKTELSDYFISGKMSQPFRDPSSPISWTDQVRFYVDTASVEKYLDELTGCFNRKYFSHKLTNYMNTQMKYARRGKTKIQHYGDDVYGIFMIDIDHFKNVNDVYGHAMGDKILKSVGKLLRETVGDSGVVVRNGGEEFVVVYLAKYPYDFSELAELINQKFRDNIRVEDTSGLKGRDVTCSIGFVDYPFYENAEHVFDLQQHVNLADMAMYVSKTTGRDRWNELKATRVPTDKIDTSLYLNSPEYGLKRGYYVLRNRDGEHNSLADK